MNKERKTKKNKEREGKVNKKANGYKQRYW